MMVFHVLGYVVLLIIIVLLVAKVYKLKDEDDVEVVYGSKGCLEKVYCSNCFWENDKSWIMHVWWAYDTWNIKSDLRWIDKSICCYHPSVVEEKSYMSGWFLLTTTGRENKNYNNKCKDFLHKSKGKKLKYIRR